MNIDIQIKEPIPADIKNRKMNSVNANFLHLYMYTYKP